MPSSVAGGFPGSRPDRDPVAAASSVAEGAAPPSVRLWPFQMRNNVGTGRVTVVSPRFTGPAIISDVSVRCFVPGVAGIHPYFVLLISDDNSGQGFNLPAALPSGQPIWEPSSVADESGEVAADVPGIRMAPGPNQGQVGWDWVPLGYVTQREGFYLKATFNVVVAGDVAAWGSVRIVERPSPQALANFL